MRNLLIVLLIVLIVTFSCFVSATNNCFQHGCVDLNLPPDEGGQGLLGFSSNNNNVMDSINYTKCDLDTGNWTPVSTDFDGDGFPDFVVIAHDTINVYTSRCDLKWTQQLPSRVWSAPVLTNYDGDSQQELVIQNSTHVTWWGFVDPGNTSAPAFSETAISLNYTSLPAYLPAEGLTCASGGGVEKYCTVFGTTNTVANIDYNLQTVTVKTALKDATIYPFRYLNGGITSTRTVGNTQWMTPVCYRGFTGGAECDIINSTGDDLNRDMILTGDAGGGGTSLYQHDVFIAEIDGISRVYGTVADSVASWHFISDLNFNIKYQKYISGTKTGMSNFVIGDFDKAGAWGNIACGIINGSGQLNFSCFDVNGNYLLQNDISSVMNMSNIVMADFMPNNSYMCVGSVEGIFCYDGSGFSKNFTSGVVWDSTKDGSLIVVNTPTTSSPIMVYQDFDGVSFLMENVEVSDSCGNDVCDSFETAFSCPADCGSVSTDQCDPECILPYVCIENSTGGNFCVQFATHFNGTTLACNFNTDCPTSEPHCVNGICVRGTPGGVGITDIEDAFLTDEQTANWWDEFWSDLGMNTPLKKFFIGLIFVAMLTGGTAGIIFSWSQGSLNGNVQAVVYVVSALGSIGFVWYARLWNGMFVMFIVMTPILIFLFSLFAKGGGSTSGGG